MSSEREVVEFLHKMIKELVMEGDMEEVYCPNKTDHSCTPSIQNSQARKRIARLHSANRQKYTTDDRNIWFTPELVPEDRCLQKQLGYAKYCLTEIYKIPFHRILINREQNHTSIQGQIVNTRQDANKSKRRWISGRQKTEKEGCE